MAIIEILKETEALLEGHFLLSSGKHSDRYVQCAKVLRYPDKAMKVLEPVVEQLKDLDKDLVVRPAMGGIVVAYELGRQLGKEAIFTERVDGKMELRRGFEVKKGQRIIISEDVVTTGKSSFEVKELLESMGAVVIGIASIVDRTNEDIGIPLYSSIKLEIIAHDVENCPLCKENIPYIKPGSRNIK